MDFNFSEKEISLLEMLRDPTTTLESGRLTMTVSFFLDHLYPPRSRYTLNKTIPDYQRKPQPFAIALGRCKELSGLDVL